MVTSQESTGQLSMLLLEWSEGNRDAWNRLAPLIYGELRKLARSYMARESPGHSFNPSDLIHEAYFKLCDFRNPQWSGGKHFFVVASKVMREILIDHARKKRCVKQGGEYRRVALDDAIHEVQDSTNPIGVLLLDRALTNLSQIDDRKAQVIELWYFGGMTAKEIADTLDISTATVNRDMDIARAFLAKETRRGEHDQTILE